MFVRPRSLWERRLGTTYAPVVGAAVPEGAAAPPAPPTGTLTGEPGTGGSLPDGEADPEPGAPDAPDSPLDGELGVPVDPAAAGVGVAVTVL